MDEYLQGILTGLGIEITDESGDYRTTVEILTDIAHVWDTLKSSIQEAIADQLIEY